MFSLLSHPPTTKGATMIDDELDLVRELFAADDTPLDPATRDRVLDRIAAGLAAAADEERSPSNGAATPHRSRRRRRLVFAVSAMAAAVLLLAVLLPSGGGARRGLPSALAPHHAPTTHAVAPHHARTIHFQVTGYTQPEATAAATQCLSAAGADDPAHSQKGAALRATFSDPSGSTLVVTTPSGWYTCNESADGTVTPYIPYESYVQAEGGALNANDLYAHWLMEPVELFSDGGGYVSKATMASGWLDVALGRVAPNITKVTVQMPGGSVIAASVENGFFVARQLLPSMPAFVQSPVGTPTPVMGYDSSGTLVYDSLLTRLPLTACFVTPSGQPLTPSATSSQGCQTAIAWGY